MTELQRLQNDLNALRTALEAPHMPPELVWAIDNKQKIIRQNPGASPQEIGIIGRNAWLSLSQSEKEKVKKKTDAMYEESYQKIQKKIDRIQKKIDKINGKRSNKKTGPKKSLKKSPKKTVKSPKKSPKEQKGSKKGIWALIKGLF
jgi:valyl-tRNA synthetase